MTFDDLTDTDRHIVRVALKNHSIELEKAAKKMETLGRADMALRLQEEVEAVADRIRPIFEEQRSLAFK